MGAMKISIKLNLSKKEHGDKYWGAHQLLKELESERHLEQNKVKVLG